MLNLVSELKGEEYERIKASLSEDEKKDLLAQLIKHRNSKDHSPRATNKACQQDAVQTANRIEEVVSAGLPSFMPVLIDFIAARSLPAHWGGLHRALHSGGRRRPNDALHCRLR